MNFNQLSNQFNNGINWNACFYITYKSISTIVTFLLYQQLTPHDFAIWAITNSTIYIMLLWADLGLRKSIPRYSPVFAQNPEANTRFIKFILSFYIIILCCLSLVFMAGVIKTAQIYIQNPYVMSYLVYCAPMIFIFEGINTLLRLLFHAYFLIKQFNILSTIYLIINLILDIIAIYTQTTSGHILKYIFINKVVVGCALAITSLYLFYKTKPKKTKITPSDNIVFSKTLKAFSKHSGMMWLNTVLKSISERNSLVPLIALFGGAQSASIFKVANDGALLFQRVVLKTIGTTDTSFLTHIETSSEGKKLLQVAFTKLAQKVATLCLPLIGISLFIGISNIHTQITSEGFQLFIILTLCYLMEILLLPYERVLEVKHDYKRLLIAYMPYVLFLTIILFYTSKAWIGLVNFVCLVYFVRLVSISIMVGLARNAYHVRYPIKYACNLFGLICTTSIGLYLVTTIININPYVSFIVLLKTLK